MCLELRVAIYAPAPSTGHEHWALFIDDGPKSTIFQVEGTHPNSLLRVSTGRPEANSFRCFRKSLYLGESCRDDVKRMYDVMSKVLVNNEDRGWNSQDYILEMMEELVEGWLLDDSPEYYSARKELMARRALTA